MYKKRTTVINKDVLMVARENKGYTQKEVSDMVGIFPGTYFLWESGETKRADTTKYKELCKILGIEGE